jgi:enoyl-CoA hydratase/carnithine racemase
MADHQGYPLAEEMVLYEKDPKTKIATITLNRPDSLNAMTVDARFRYADLVHRANIDDDVQVLVIRGNGPHLGSGADLQEQFEIQNGRGDLPIEHMMRISNEDEITYPPMDSYRYRAQNQQYMASARAGHRSLQEFKKISILEVRGYCYGWHFYQAADADMVIAAEDSLFGHAAFRYAGWAARQWEWCTMMGVRKFMEMVFTGRPFTAKEMYDCNFVNAVVPFDELEATTRKYALACARSRPTDTVFAQKTFFEIYKQFQGEYMGSILSGVLESLGNVVKPDGEAMELDREDIARDPHRLTDTVRGNDEAFPPEWRLSYRGRAQGGAQA